MEEQLRREEFLRSAEEWDSIILGRSLKAGSGNNNNGSDKEDKDTDEDDAVSHTGTRETLVCSVSAAAAAARAAAATAAASNEDTASRNNAVGGSADSMRTVFSNSENVPFHAVEEAEEGVASPQDGMVPSLAPPTSSSSTTVRSSSSAQSQSLNRSIRLVNVLQDSQRADSS